MNSVDLVKAICKERKIPISRLESDLGFSNGYIRGLKKGKFPSDRLNIVADYLNVSVDYLLTGSEKEKPGIILDAEQEKVLEMFRNATPEVRQIVLAVLKTGTQQP